MPTERRKAISRALGALAPRIPFLDAEAVREQAGSRHMRELGTQSAVWLALIAHIRHQHTDYDALRDEGYERDEARFFVLDEVNAVLNRWACVRQLRSDPEGDEDAHP